MALRRSGSCRMACTDAEFSAPPPLRRRVGGEVQDVGPRFRGPRVPTDWRESRDRSARSGWPFAVRASNGRYSQVRRVRTTSKPGCASSSFRAERNVEHEAASLAPCPGLRSWPPWPGSITISRTPRPSAGPREATRQLVAGAAGAAAQAVLRWLGGVVVTPLASSVTAGEPERRSRPGTCRTAGGRIAEAGRQRQRPFRGEEARLAGTAGPLLGSFRNRPRSLNGCTA